MAFIDTTEEAAEKAGMKGEGGASKIAAAKQAAEKQMISLESCEKHTSGAKARVGAAAVAARLKSCPFKTASFSATCKAGARFAALTARLKPCPYYKASFNGVFLQALKSCPFKTASFSAACKAGAHFAALTARLKPCPYYKASFNGVFLQAVKSCPFQKLAFEEFFSELLVTSPNELFPVL